MPSHRLTRQTLAPMTRGGARRDLDRIVRTLIPGLADFCLLHLLSHGSIRAAAWAHATPEGERLLQMLTRRYRIVPGNPVSGVASVLRSARPLLRTGIQIDEAVAHRGDLTVVDLHRELAPRSALVVPILTSSATAGALTLCFSQSGRTYAARDIPAATRVAVRIACLLGPSTGDGRAVAAAAGRPDAPAVSPRRRATPRH